MEMRLSSSNHGPQRDQRSRPNTVREWALTALFLLACCGCTRTMYRNWADRKTYGEVQERNNDPRWKVEKLSVYGDPRARFMIHSIPIIPPCRRMTRPPISI